MPKSKLPTFIQRNNNNNIFDFLKPDEQIFAHLALVYKELIKYNYSSLIGFELDDIRTEQQMNGLDSERTGGLKWFNYMYSDNYDDEDAKTDNEGKVFAALSISEALKKYGVMAGDWPGIVCTLGKWYEKNIHTYQSETSGHTTGRRKFYPCPLFKTNNATNGVGDDCTSFCFACIQLYWDLALKDRDETIFKELMASYPPASLSWGNPNNIAAQNMEKYGFDILPYSPHALQPWDMVMGSKDAGAYHGHGEIYVGPYKGGIKEFGWGNIHDGIGHAGMPAGTKYNEGEYSLIFRLKGIKNMTAQEVEKIIDKYA